ncbi:thioredoxin domain-containing protein [Planctobacterium marinum]|uniref:thioredoxin domain-containing protein n=1 Tax=Planctobacterium marinum TaxID=1631968 RepID=UPI001E55044B|nr:DUF255 domain-containing protein [Planctobacterium marinum]MCC2606108.1 DUF255 domain-containing protein [Planctobacterium marinum]
MAYPDIPPESDISLAEHANLLELYQQRILNGPEISGVERKSWPFVNQLIKEGSPYLLQHASDPVNWHSWSDENLAKAHQQEKLIFLSIGFSTCYWCQVMKNESFHNPQVARLLNSRFLPVKVDRELQPDLDSYFVSALEKTKGTAGWPVTAVLTTKAELLYIDSFLNTEELMKVLQRYADTAREYPQQLQNHVALMLKIVGTMYEFQKVETVATPDWKKYREELKARIDKANGGLNGQPKFPEAAMLLLMIDEFWRTQAPDVQGMLHLQLQNMASRGLYDHVNGGFHRYVSDEEWTVPHYEKMLYTQALMLLVYSKASQLEEGKHYRHVALDIFNFLYSNMKTENGLFASAIDAAFQGSEGGYYLYSEEQLAVDKVANLRKAGVSLYRKNGLFGLHVKRPYNSEFKEIRLSLSKTHEKTALIIDDKAITSWNALLIWALSESYKIFNDARFIVMAQELASELLRRNRDSEQLYRASLGTLLAGSAVFEDYAFLVRALIALYDISSNENWLSEAMTLYPKAMEMVNSSKQLSPFNVKIQPEYIDGEIFNPLAVMYEVAYLLWQRTGDLGFRDDTNALKGAMLKLVSAQHQRQFYAAKVLQSTQKGLPDTIHYFAQSNGKVSMVTQPDCTRLFKVEMAPGWHINSEQPWDSELIPTDLQATKEPFKQVHYPVPGVIAFGVDQKEVSVFSNRLSIIGEGGSGVAQMQIQACSDIDEICLIPEKITFPLTQCQY